MSVAIGAAVSASKDTPTLPSNKKAEDQTNSKVEKLCCEFNEKSEDLGKEFSKESEDSKDDCVKCEQLEMNKVLFLFFHFRIIYVYLGVKIKHNQITGQQVTLYTNCLSLFCC